VWLRKRMTRIRNAKIRVRGSYYIRGLRLTIATGCYVCKPGPYTQVHNEND
jgi:hypothetical protein